MPPPSKPPVDPRSLRLLGYEDLHVGMRENLMKTVMDTDIIGFARDPRNGLTGYRVPKLVEFRESLPETLVGKVLRRVLLDEERANAAAATRER